MAISKKDDDKQGTADSSSDNNKNETAKDRAAAAKHARDAGELAASEPDYKVAAGKSLTTCRGIVDGGQPVTAMDFCRSAGQLEHGQKRLDLLVQQDLVIKKGQPAKTDS